MATEAVTCPQCGGPLEAVIASGFYTCPYCSSRIRVSFFEPDPNLQPDGRTTVRDAATQAELCSVQLPHGWKAGGRIQYEHQSLNWPFTLYVQAGSPRQDAIISYRSGSSFKEVIASSVLRHQEGGFDQGEMMPMMRLRTAAQYADQFVGSQLSRGVPYHFVEERALAKTPPEDYAAKMQELMRNTSDQLRANTPPGMFSAVDRAFCEGTTRIYAYTENGHDMRKAVAVVVNGVQISFGSPMVFFGGKTTYVLWDVPYVVSLTATASAFDGHYDHLVMFLSTMQASLSLLQQMDWARNQILTQLGRQQQNNFAAHQRMIQEQQAAFDAYNRSWMADSERRHQAARYSEAARQNSEDRMSDMRSEATRGVNTYIRPDGTEVEYSVVNENAYAYVNDSRTTFATLSHAFESPDWTPMRRKY